MVLSGWAVLRVSVKAIYNGDPAADAVAGAIPGAPSVALPLWWRFFRHAIEVLVYIIFVSVMGLAVESIVAGRLPAQLGGNNPFAHVLMMGAVSVAAMMLLRYHPRRPVGRTTRTRPARPVPPGRQCPLAWGCTPRSAARAVPPRPGRKLGSRLRNRGNTQWEQMEADATSNARQIHGAPQPGFDPVPSDGSTHGSGAGGSSGGAAEQPTAGGIDPGGAAPRPAGGGEPALSAPRRRQGSRACSASTTRAPVPATATLPRPSGSPPATELPGNPGGSPGSDISAYDGRPPEARYLDEFHHPRSRRTTTRVSTTRRQAGPSAGPPTTVNPITNT